MNYARNVAQRILLRLAALRAALPWIRVFTGKRNLPRRGTQTASEARGGTEKGVGVEAAAAHNGCGPYIELRSPGRVFCPRELFAHPIDPPESERVELETAVAAVAAVSRSVVWSTEGGVLLVLTEEWGLIAALAKTAEGGGGEQS